MIKQCSFKVAGVDGCKAGWFVAIVDVLKHDQCFFDLKEVFVAKDFAEVISRTTDCVFICVDIPIGLSDGDKPRECDIAARKLLRGPRASSVFPAPIRPCLKAKDYKTACQISQQYCGKRLSKQSFVIMKKISEVDELMTQELQNRVREIHPEILFWALNNSHPMQHNKKTLVGRNERMKLLSPIFSELEKLVVEAHKPKQVAPDDILDSLAAAWTAGHVVIGNFKTLPEKPENDSRGLRMEIVYPIGEF
jgi:predicted RNase H-like nuclease